MGVFVLIIFFFLFRIVLFSHYITKESFADKHRNTDTYIIITKVRKPESQYLIDIVFRNALPRKAQDSVPCRRTFSQGLSF